MHSAGLPPRRSFRHMILVTLMPQAESGQEQTVEFIEIFTSSSRLMIFAVATDERVLYTFPSTAEATSYCEGVDVEDAGWLFWDDKGRPLSPHFTVPNKRGWFSAQNGEYYLELTDERHHVHLLEALDEIVSFSSAAPFSTALEVRSYISQIAPNDTDC